MAYKIMIQGTMSNAGKSFIVTGLCRAFSNLGYRVAPFKSQNMALNSGVTPDGLEMGRAQIVQAEAARTVPDVRMNPILLKPNSDIGSQVIVMGKPVGNMKAAEYYEYKPSLIPVIREAFSSLEEDYDVIIVEGAGSPAEINLKENDIVNMGLAKMLELPVLLAGDIDLGGVFAQLLGTLEWLDNEERNIIKGMIINKFRGDVTLLTPGIKMLEERTGKKVTGVIPYSTARIDAEDSVTADERMKKSGRAFLNNQSDINITVIRLPHMSNFTDFTPLENIDGVQVTYLASAEELNKAYEMKFMDLLIIPGTKNTAGDLKWMKKNGIADFVKAIVKSVPVMGICGGNQILGVSVADPDEIEGKGEEEGLALINQKTVMDKEKTLKKVKGVLKCEGGFFSCLNGVEYEGYEIHSGLTEASDKRFSEDVFGTYIHGIFDCAGPAKALINGLRKRKGLAEYEGVIKDYKDLKDSEYEAAAKTVSEALDMEMLFGIMGIE